MRAIRSAASGVPLTVPPGLSISTMMAVTLASASASSISSASSSRSQQPNQPSTFSARTPRALITATDISMPVISSSHSINS